MNLGLSIYSLDSLIAKGEMTLQSALDWAAKQGAKCAELVPFSYSFVDAGGAMDKDAIRAARRHAKDAGIELVNYSILANLCSEDNGEQEAEIRRVMTHVDIAAELGLPRMRHDISSFRRTREEIGIAYFERLFPRMVDAASRIAKRAASVGVTTMLENHGFFVNGCDRCERLVRAVNRDNYRMLLDTGNIACVDEDPAAAAQKLAPLAEMIHLKDFYIRKRDPGDTTEFDCGGHWFRSNSGKYLRGSILGQGDLDVYEILGAIKASGYNKNIAIEFEGFEDPRYASRVSMDNAHRIWNEV